MMVSERLRRPFGTLLLLAFLSPSVSLAEATKEAKETARTLMAEGRDARDEKKDYKAALEAFRKAHSIMKVPSTGLEVARTLDQMGLYIEAEQAAMEVVNLPAQGKEPEAFVKARAEAKALAETAKTKIATVMIVLKGAKPEAVEVTIDELTVAPDALANPLRQNPGKHTIVAKGPRTDTAEIELGPGESKEVTLNVKAADKPKVEDKSVEPTPTATTQEKSAFLRPLPLIGFGLAGVGIIAGSVTGALTLSKASDIKSKCSDTQCPRSKHDDIESAKTLGLVSTISFAAAGVGVVVGVVGLMMKPPPPTTGVRVTPWIGLQSAGLSGQF